MAYYFMVEKKRGIYEKLDFTKSKYFNPSDSAKVFKTGSCNLQAIDDFTMMFNNETELRTKLIQEEILDLSLADKPLSIRLSKNGETKKVPLDFMYQHDLEYIKEPKRLIALISKRDLDNDFLFLEKYGLYFSKHRDCLTTAPELARYAESSIEAGCRSIYLDKTDSNGDRDSVRMTKLLIYDYYQPYSGKVYYDHNKIKYSHLHAIVAFINNHNKKYAKTDNQNESINGYSIVTAKKRTKKKDPIEGQFSLFDE